MDAVAEAYYNRHWRQQVYHIIEINNVPTTDTTTTHDDSYIYYYNDDELPPLEN